MNQIVKKNIIFFFHHQATFYEFRSKHFNIAAGTRANFCYSFDNEVIIQTTKGNISKHKDSNQPIMYQNDGGKENIIIYIAFVFRIGKFKK